MKRAIAYAVGFAALNLVLGGCAGGSHSLLPSSGNGKSAAVASVTFVIKVPARTASSKRKPQFISPSAQSVMISGSGSDFNTGTLVNLTPTSQGCTSVSGGTQCTVQMNLPVGQDTYSVMLYDQQNATGNMLGMSYGQVNIVEGTVNSVNIVVDGIPTTYKIALNGSVSAGTPSSVPVIVSGYDADGNLIVGDLSDGASITEQLELALTDPNNDFTLMQNGTPLKKDGNGYYVLQVDQQYDEITSNVTLAYNGGLQETVSLAGLIIGNSSPFQTVSLTVGPASKNASMLYVAGSGTLFGFPGGAGDSAPYSYDNGIADITDYQATASLGGCGVNSAPITVDPNGNVVSWQWRCADDSYTAVIAAYAPGSNTPAWTITNEPSGPIFGMGYDSAGYAYFEPDMGKYSPDGGATTYQDSTCIAVYKPGVTGKFNQSTMIDHEIGCQSTAYRVNLPVGGFAVARNGTVYVDVAENTQYEGVNIYAPGATDPSSATALYGSNTGIATAKGLAVDSSGQLYAANYGNNTVTVYAAGAGGNASPIATISGSNTMLCGPTAIAVDQFGEIYVLNSASAQGPGPNTCTNPVGTQGSVTVYASGATGNAAPVRVYANGGAQADGGLALIK